jgi:hypothetical protein
MTRALILALGVSLCAVGLAAAAPAKAPVAAAAPPANDPTIGQPGWKAPRNAFGQPDLSGYWSNATLTPLVRNARLTPKATLTPQEAHAMEKVWADAEAESNAPTDPKESTQDYQAKSSEAKLINIRPDFALAGGAVGGYNAFWLDPGNSVLEVNGEFRTSILTTANGLPPAKKPGLGGGMPRFRDVYDNVEDRSLGERCITSFGRNAPPPMLPNGFYNNDYYIIQTPDTVAIQVELIHDVRIVRLNAQHRTDGVRPFAGDSIGHWDGDTLVVETTNFPQSDAFMGSWKNLKVTERFTRVSPTRVNYQFTVEDPDTWDKPWGGEYDFTPMKGIIYEYVCHEGNYAIRNILAGARAKEKAAAAKPATGGER